MGTPNRLSYFTEHYMRLPKVTERLSTLFPLSQVVIAIALISMLPQFGVLFAVLWIYLSGPFVWRLFALFFRFEFGKTQIGTKQATSVWMISYNLQLLYSVLPQLEKLLLLVPELYSAWLRLWGASIGRNVFWTPGVEVVDRPLITIGHQVVVGQKTYLSAHVIVKRNSKTFLFLRPISIGDTAIIGAFSVLSAGALVGSSETIMAGSVCSAKKRRLMTTRGAI